MKKVILGFIMIVGLVLNSTDALSTIWDGKPKTAPDDYLGCFLFQDGRFSSEAGDLKPVIAEDGSVTLGLSSHFLLIPYYFTEAYPAPLTIYPDSVASFMTNECIAKMRDTSDPYSGKNYLYFDSVGEASQDRIKQVFFKKDAVYYKTGFDFYTNDYVYKTDVKDHIDIAINNPGDYVISGAFVDLLDKDTLNDRIILSRTPEETSTSALLNIKVNNATQKVDELEISNFYFKNMKGEAIALYSAGLKKLVVKNCKFENIGSKNNPVIKIYQHQYTIDQDGDGIGDTDAVKVTNIIDEVIFEDNEFISDTPMKSPDVYIENLKTNKITFRNNVFKRPNFGEVYNVYIKNGPQGTVNSYKVQLSNDPKTSGGYIADINDYGDNSDRCKLNILDTIDTDGDMIGNKCDNDDDNDKIYDDGIKKGLELGLTQAQLKFAEMNVSDLSICSGTNIGCQDNCPLKKNTDQADKDKDMRGDVCDEKDDSLPDTSIITDIKDLFKGVFGRPVITKQEIPQMTKPDLGEPDDPIDTDADGTPDETDNCPLVANPDQTDADGDGIGDACETPEQPTDTDGDGTPDPTDNCPLVANPDQTDSDGDGIGDACETTEPPKDTDGDGIPDTTDNCLVAANTDQTDTDGDGIGDVCETPEPPKDTDGDGTPDPIDNCPLAANPDQTDTDGDGIGDACETTEPPKDTDGDGIPDTTDNCLLAINPDQADTDQDGIGDACDTPIIDDPGDTDDGGNDSTTAIDEEDRDTPNTSTPNVVSPEDLQTPYAGVNQITGGGCSLMPRR